MGEHVKHVPIKEKDGEVEDYLYVDDVARAARLRRRWGRSNSTAGAAASSKLEKPDRLVFDLDPDVGLDFGKVKDRRRCGCARCSPIWAWSAFPLLTGGKGIHVVVPARRVKADWPTVKSFAERFSRAIAEAEPERFTANIRKAQRKGRIFLDWLRNQRGATAIMPYSARAREGAPVAAPIAWEELDEYQGGNAFTIRDADVLIERAASKLLAGWGKAKQKLPKA